MNTLGDAVKEILDVIETSVFKHSCGDSYVLIEERAAKKLANQLKAAYLAESKQEPTDKLSRLTYDLNRLESIVYDASPQILDLQKRVAVIEKILARIVYEN